MKRISIIVLVLLAGCSAQRNILTFDEALDDVQMTVKELVRVLDADRYIKVAKSYAMLVRTSPFDCQNLDLKQEVFKIGSDIQDFLKKEKNKIAQKKEQDPEILGNTYFTCLSRREVFKDDPYAIEVLVDCNGDDLIFSGLTLFYGRFNVRSNCKDLFRIKESNGFETIEEIAKFKLDRMQEFQEKFGFEFKESLGGQNPDYIGINKFHRVRIFSENVMSLFHDQNTADYKLYPVVKVDIATTNK